MGILLVNGNIYGPKNPLKVLLFIDKVVCNRQITVDVRRFYHRIKKIYTGMYIFMAVHL